MALLTDTAVIFLTAFVTKNFAARCDLQAENTLKCMCGWGFTPGPMVYNQMLPQSIAPLQSDAPIY